MGRKTLGLSLSAAQTSRLTALAGSADADGRMSRRAAVVLLSSEGKSLKEISKQTGLNEKNCWKWLVRYRQAGLEGLKDKRRSGRPSVIAPEKKGFVVSLAASTPENGGGAWSCRKLSRETGLSSATVNRILRGVRP
jgi:lambda repressor-like predicted transcriptional regulator